MVENQNGPTKTPKQRKRIKINFTYPKKTEIDEKVSIFRQFLRKQWIKLTIWFLTFTGSLVCFAMTGNTLKSSLYENLYTSITETAVSNDSKKQNLTISYAESASSYKEFRSFVSMYNPHDDRNYPFTCFLTVSSRVNPHAFQISSDDGATLTDSTLISPKTFGLIEMSDGFYEIDSIPLAVLYRTKRQSSGTFCFISTKHAEKLMHEWNVDNMEELLGKNLDTYYKVNGTQVNLQMYIANIYDVSRNYASYLTDLYDDFILAYTLNSKNIDNTELSITVGHSLLQNHMAMNLLLENFSIEQFDYRFMQENHETLWNESLEHKFNNYILFNEASVRGKYISYVVSAMIFFLVSSIFLAEITLSVIRYKLISYRKYSFVIFAIAFLCIALLYVLFKYAFAAQVLIGTEITRTWLVMLLLEIIYMVMFLLIEKKRGNKHEAKNEIE